MQSSMFYGTLKGKDPRKRYIMLI